MSVLESVGPVRFVPIDVSVAGDFELVALIPGRRIRVLALAVVADSSVSITFKSGLVAITGPVRVSSEHQLAADTPWGCFETEEGKPLVLGLSADNQVSGWLSYQEVR